MSVAKLVSLGAWCSVDIPSPGGRTDLEDGVVVECLDDNGRVEVLLNCAACHKDGYVRVDDVVVYEFRTLRPYSRVDIGERGYVYLPPYGGWGGHLSAREHWMSRVPSEWLGG